MPNSRGFVPIEGSRSHTRLIKGQHSAPAGDWVLDKQFMKESLKEIYPNGVLLNYMYGGPGMEDVTIPQGRVVGVQKSFVTFHDGVAKTPLTLPGMSLNNNVVGVVPYNITKDWLEENFLGGNKPMFVNDDYVVVPYAPGFTPSTSMNEAGIKEEELEISLKNHFPWGALIGQAQEGDYVKATPSGRFTKLDKSADSPFDLVGQILEMDLNSESWGWEKWMMLPSANAAQSDAFVRKTDGRLPEMTGWPYDDKYRDGLLDMWNGYQHQFTYNPNGLRGLHDGTGNYKGFGRNDTVYADMPLGDIPAQVTADQLFSIQAVDYVGNPAKNVQPESVEIKINGTKIDAARVSV
ncbi:MAG: hypothetical protein ACRDBY_00585, partial [Cetobacterium sp.]